LHRALQLAGDFLRLIGRFGRAKGGNIALIFAVTLIPMLAATGMVVDYTRAAKARSQLQDALDSTALFLSKNSSVSTMNSAQLLAAAQTYFNVNFTNTDVTGTSISPSYSSSGPSVTVSGTTNSPCSFMSVLGIRQIPVAGTSTAVWGHARLRVALVLDNTGSMSSSGKLTALKTATTNLLTQLKNAASVNGDVYVSIVPFVKDVNIGTYTSAMNSYVAFDDTANCNPSSSTCDGWWDGTNGSCNKTAGWGQSNSPRSNCLALGSCSVTGQGYSTCASTSGCFVSGTYTSTYTTSSTCTASGTCSSASYTTQSTCLAVGSCSVTSGTYSNCTTTSGCFLSANGGTGTYTSTYTTSSACSGANNK
jgi:Flp pilus assembly protein TadG